MKKPNEPEKTQTKSMRAQAVHYVMAASYMLIKNSPTTTILCMVLSVFWIVPYFFLSIMYKNLKCKNAKKTNSHVHGVTLTWSRPPKYIQPLQKHLCMFLFSPSPSRSSLWSTEQINCVSIHQHFVVYAIYLDMKFCLILWDIKNASGRSAYHLCVYVFLLYRRHSKKPMKKCKKIEIKMGE